MTAVYTNFCGMVVHQSRNGIERDIIPDPLGSVAHLVDEDQNITASYTYTPYGEIESHTGEDTPLNFVGTLGYYRDTLVSKLTYIRARWYKAEYGRWMTVDPLWPGERAFGYADGNPESSIDPSGLMSKPCYSTPRNTGICGIGGPLPCTRNTNEYARDCAKTGNKLSCCASCVSAFLCDLLYLAAGSPSWTVPGDLAEKIACQNSCMIKLWREKRTRKWEEAKRVCKQFGQKSRQCCIASVAAEQDGYNICAPQCFPDLNRIPYELRKRFAIDALKCCD